MSLLSIAEEARNWFKLKEIKREGEDAKTIYVKKDGAPDWLTELVRDAHGDMLPDDYKYDYVVLALDAIIAGDGNIDGIQFEPDIYNRDLLNWLNSSLTRASYVDEASEEFDLGPSVDTYTRIGYGQIREKEEILNSVIKSLEGVS